VAKIACLTPMYFSDESYIGGGERYPLNLSRGIVESTGGAYSVDLISFGPKSRSHQIAPGLTVRVLAAARPPINPLDVVSWELPSAIADADLVHVHQAYTRCSEVAYLVAKQQGKPIVVTDHGGTTSTLGTSVGSLELADHIISNSKFGASLYRTSTPITVIKGGVDGAHFTPPRQKVERDRILFVGRLLPHKGIDQLIRALPPDLPLTICGRPYQPEYFEVLKGLCAGKDVMFFTDADDDAIRELYRRAWVNVLPSVYRDYYGQTHLCPELMGFTLLEAMACGTPAICSNVAGMPEYVLDGETGYVFDDLPMLTDRLQRLASDPALVDRLGREARRRVEIEYDFRVAGARMVAVYEPLIARVQEQAA
jgi:glycosyltransferase involved in cell wall biosynthesis